MCSDLIYFFQTVQTTNALTDAEVHPDLPFPEVAMGTLGVSDHMQHHALALGVSSHALSVRKEILPELPLSNTEVRLSSRHILVCVRASLSFVSCSNES